MLQPPKFYPEFFTEFNNHFAETLTEKITWQTSKGPFKPEVAQTS